MSTYLNGISPTTIPGSEDTCFFVMPPDENFILDLLPGHPNISIFTGESGQAFKFGPLVGTILSQLATKGSKRRTIFPTSRSLVRESSSSRPDHEPDGVATPVDRNRRLVA